MNLSTTEIIIAAVAGIATIFGLFGVAMVSLGRSREKLDQLKTDVKDLERDMKADVKDFAGVVVNAGVETIGVGAFLALPGDEERTVERVRALDGVSTVAIESRDQKQVLVVQTVPGAELTHAILGQLDGRSVGRVSSREPTLEDAYVALVGE